MSSDLIDIVNFPPLGDHRGSLVSVEAGINVPFDIKRAFYIFNTRKDVARGFHAHKAVEQMAICVTGQCKMLLDNGTEKAEIWLDSPTKGLLIRRFIWTEIYDFSPDCVLLVLANQHYEESDYIREYDEFMGYVKQGKSAPHEI